MAILTFSKSAAKELVERVHKKLIQNCEPDNSTLINCIHNFNSNCISTIHSFFYEILSIPALSDALKTKISSTDPYKHVTEFLLEDIFDYFECHLNHSNTHWNFYQKNLFLSKNSIEKEVLKTLDDVRNMRSLEKNIVLIKPVDSNLQNILKVFLSQNIVSEKGSALGDFSKTIQSMLQDTNLSDKKLTNILERLLFSVTPNNTSLLREIDNLQSDNFLIKNLLSELFSLKSDKLIPFNSEKIEKYETIYAIKYNLQKILHLIQTKKKFRGNLDQNDIIGIIYNAMQNQDIAQIVAKEISKQIKMIVIDEFQDTDYRQWYILKTICDYQKISLFLVGDPKQCIYGFRGGNVYTYKKAKQCVSPEQFEVLKENYRSTPNVISAINYMFSKILSKENNAEILYQNTKCGKSSPNETKKIFINDKVQAGCTLIKIESEEKNPSIGTIRTWTNYAFVTEIQTLLQKGTIQDSQNSSLSRKIELSDICILCSNNNECAEMQAILNKYNIANAITAKGTIFETYECLAMEDLLESLLDPQNRSKRKLVLLGVFFELSPKILSILEETGSITVVFETFSSWQKKLYAHGILSIFEEICNYGKQLSKILVDHLSKKELYLLQLSLSERIFHTNPSSAAKRRWINIQHIFTFVAEIQKLHRIPPQKLAWHLNYERELYEYGISEENLQFAGLKSFDQENCVKIMTVHKSKGLEFGIVFLMFGVKTNTHRSNKDLFVGPLYFDIFTETRIKEGIKTDHSSKMEEEETLQESLRVFYVACTRAKYKLYIPIIYTPAGYSTKKYNINKLCGYFLQNDLSKAVDFLKENDIKELCNIDPLQFSYATDAPPPPSVLYKKYQEEKAICEEERASREEIEENLIAEQQQKYTYFETKFFQDKKIQFGSFSSILHTLKNIQPQETLEESFEKNDEPKDTVEGGAIFGNLVHKLFELIDFSTVSTINSYQKLLENSNYIKILQSTCLEFYPKNWFESNKMLLSSLLWNTLHKKINVETSFSPIILGQIPHSQRKSELKFTFQVSQLQKHLTQYPSFLQHDVNTLFSSQNILSGFIDFVFIHDHKYYILDWKTNYLGSSPEDYNQEKLHKEMEECLYLLQSTLYVSALRTFLQLTKKNFSYEKDMGGCLYLFTRGIRATESDQYGIYYHKPNDESLLLPAKFS